VRALLACLLVCSSALASPLRLPDDAAPVRYEVTLAIDPRAEAFSGSVDIELDMRRPTDTLWLDGEDLTVTRASLRTNGVDRTARVLTGDRHVLGFAFERPILPAKARLHIEYRGPLSATQITGIGKQRQGGDDYVITQLAPIDARRAFPCFDEPGFKVPWQLTLVVPSRDHAFSNTPMIDEVELGDGRKRVRFAATPPLPSYLVAFAVGPFDVVDAGRSSTSGTPVRVVVPKGDGRFARWPIEVTHEALERVEAYFGTNVPFGKLDVVAAPHFAYGAMENPGLVVVDGSVMLVADEDESIDHRRDYAETIVHELSHQWFGNLVTMRWWDDVWLSESFATWVTQGILDAWQPSWGAAQTRIEQRRSAMAADALADARPIRRPIDTYDDIQTVYDGITYDKGATVIAMFEKLVGAGAFRAGVRRYLDEHAWGSADAHDFVAAISAAAHRDVAAAFFTLLTQPGTPTVSFALDCARGRSVLHLAQRRFRPPDVATVPDATWQIPVCVRTPSGPQCTLLSTPKSDLALQGGCPSWVAPNAGGGAYYRSALSADLLARLERAGLPSLSAAEKMSTLGDVVALADAGAAGFGAALTLGARLAGDESRHVVGAVLDAVAWLDDRGLVPEGERASYIRWLDRLFGARARSLGLRQRPGDDEDTRLLRARLVPTFASVTGDAKLVAEARAMAQAWPHDHGAIDRELVSGVLEVAARYGDEAAWKTWLEGAKAARDDGTRRTLLWALGQLRDPRLVRRSLALIEDPAFDPRDTVALLWSLGNTPEDRQLAWTWLEDHYDALAKRLPRDTVLTLPGVAAELCDEHALDAVRAFFAPRMSVLDGGARSLALSLDRLRTCAASKAEIAPAVARFFTGRRLSEERRGVAQ